jgi:hypothetical protein
VIKYFQSLPKEFYDLIDDQSSIEIVTNITSLVSINKDLKNNGVSFYDYVVQDGETPENLAHKFYGNSNKHWIVLMMNDISHPQFDWPLNINSLELYINKKYEVAANNTMSGLDWAKTNVRSYHKSIQKINPRSNDQQLTIIHIDSATYANTSASTNVYELNSGETIRVETSAFYVTYYNYEIYKNEKKRNIKMLKPEYVELIENELQDKFSL